MSVNGRVRDHYAVLGDGVGRPFVVSVDIVSEVLLEHRSVQRADDADVQSGSLLEEGLHLRAILADYAEIVPCSFVFPGLFPVQSSELSEAVGGEKDLVCIVVCDHDFRPVYHRRGNERQRVPAELQGVSLPYDHAPVFELRPEEVLHHGESFCGGYYHRFRIGLHEIHDVCRMVRFHVLDHQIVRLSSVQSLPKIVQPLMCEIAVHRIHDGGLLIEDEIGVIRHAVGDFVLSLEQVDPVVVHSDIDYVAGDLHLVLSLYVYSFILFLNYKAPDTGCAMSVSLCLIC